MTVVKFSDSQEVRDHAAKLFAAHKARILAVLPDVLVEHIGGTSIVGAFTKGDLDIAVRLSLAEFMDASEKLAALYEPYQTERWDETWAAFHCEDELPVGVQLLVIGSDKDSVVQVRDYLRANPDKLSEYNAMKLRHQDNDIAEYKADKKAFMLNLRTEAYKYYSVD